MYKGLLVILSILGVVAMQANAKYSIPAGRSINWYPAGMDCVGGIANVEAGWTNVTITGLHPNTGTDDSAVIQNAINNAKYGTILNIPAGVYYVPGEVDVPPYYESYGAI